MYIPLLQNRHFTPEQFNEIRRTYETIEQETNKLRKEIEQLKPSQYEIELKKLNDENKELKEKLISQQRQLENAEKMCNELITCLEQRQEAERMTRIIEMPFNEGEMKIEEIVIPEKRYKKMVLPVLIAFERYPQFAIFFF